MPQCLLAIMIPVHMRGNLRPDCFRIISDLNTVTRRSARQQYAARVKKLRPAPGYKPFRPARRSSLIPVGVCQFQTWQLLLCQTSERTKDCKPDTG